MRRTRKWAFVAQEATRLAGLGLSPLDIAARLGVKRSTVQRWMAAGKLQDNRRSSKPRGTATAKVTKITKPSEWAASVRAEYALSPTDEQLVTMAETALGLSQDPLRPEAVRLRAMSEFRALVKQLALIARQADIAKPEPPAAPPRRKNPTVPRPAGDPRGFLTAVNS